MYKAIPSAIAIVAALPVACATTLPPERQAAQVEQIQCDPTFTEDSDLRLLASASVLEAEPLHSHVITGMNGAEERVDGAKLVVRPPEGISAERMTRILQCHAARALLGRIDRTRFPDDPFWLPDTWVSVEVRPENGNYAVILEANDLPRNLLLAKRVREFAAAHAVAAAQ
jgi:hypothetical protein